MLWQACPEYPQRQGNAELHYELTLGHENIGGKGFCLNTQWSDDCEVVVWSFRGKRSIGNNTCNSPQHFKSQNPPKSLVAGAEEEAGQDYSDTGRLIFSNTWFWDSRSSFTHAFLLHLMVDWIFSLAITLVLKKKVYRPYLGNFKPELAQILTKGRPG